MEEAAMVRKAIVVMPDQGRVYAMGRIRAVFKADRDETAGRYSVSEWWLEPRTRGPDVHAHAVPVVSRSEISGFTPGCASKHRCRAAPAIRHLGQQHESREVEQ